MMNRLEELPRIANQALSGLQADERLRQRIVHAAREEERPRRRLSLWIPAVAATAALVVVLALLLPSLQSAPLPEIQDFAAGGTASDPSPASASTKEHGLSVNTAEDINVASLWEPGENGSFPLICLGGRIYRLLSTPASVPASALGDQLHSIDTFVTEPSLTVTNGYFSNVAAPGTEVYAITGMGGTLVAAEVNQQMRLFQRVSFNGTALLQEEDLADSLQVSGHLRSMTLYGVGSLKDASVCEDLFRLLLAQAEYDTPALLSDQQVLILELDNGLALQLAVSKGKVSACGTWSCPEFVQAFTDACQ